MSDTVSLTKTGAIAIITIDYPPVNALSPSVISGLSHAMNQAENDETILAIVLTGGRRIFIAGADIKGFAAKPCEVRRQGRELHALFSRIEKSPKPVVCAMSGAALEAASRRHSPVMVGSPMPRRPSANPRLSSG